MKAQHKVPCWLNVVVFGFFLGMNLLSFRGDYYSIDEMARYGVTKSIVMEGTLLVTRPNGQIFYSKYPILQSLAAIPFFVAGEYTAGGSTLAAKEAGGRLFVTLFNPVIGALGCFVFFRLASRFNFSIRTSLILALIFGLCTVAFPYARLFLSEPLTGLLLMVAAWLALMSSRVEPLPGILGGGALALAACNNTVAFLAFPIFFVFFLIDGVKEKERLGVRHFGDVRLAGLVFFSLLALGEYAWYNHVAGESYFSSKYFQEVGPKSELYPNGLSGFSYPLLAGVYGLLFSPARSIFLYSPPLVVALLCWPKFLKEHKKRATLILSVSVVFLLVYSKWYCWHGGYCWGPRFLVPVTGFLLLPMGLLIQDFRNRKPAVRFGVYGLCIAGFLFQLLPILLNPAYAYGKLIDTYGLQNEYMLQYLPQTCPLIEQARLLKTISSPASTDLYFLKHLDSPVTWVALTLIFALVFSSGLFYLKALRRFEP